MKEPTGDFVKGIIGVGPNHWEHLKMVTIKEPIHEFDKIYWMYSVACPWVGGYVHPSNCEKCEHGKQGSYKEHWTVCSYNHQSSNQTAKGGNND